MLPALLLAILSTTKCAILMGFIVPLILDFHFDVYRKP